jgi:hypothetical protein
MSIKYKKIRNKFSEPAGTSGKCEIDKETPVGTHNCCFAKILALELQQVGQKLLTRL